MTDRTRIERDIKTKIEERYRISVKADKIRYIEKVNGRQIDKSRERKREKKLNFKI